MPITACDLMHDRVLPFYENLGITVGSVLRHPPLCRVEIVRR